MAVRPLVRLKVETENDKGTLEDIHRMEAPAVTCTVHHDRDGIRMEVADLRREDRDGFPL